MFVKSTILEHCSCVTDMSVEDVIWLKLENRQSGHKLTLFICYLPPEGSSRRCDGEAFYSDLMLKFYEYQNEDDVIICGDFNSRCGDATDYIECVDSVRPREVVDCKINSYGQLLIDFLIDCNLCMINGRTGENDFTNINGNGSSVVDYIVVPHEQLEKYKDFKVHTMSSLINRFKMQVHYRSSEHSILQISLQTESITDLQFSTDSSRVKAQYNLSDIPASFLNCESSFQRLMETIQRIERSLCEEHDVQLAYSEFVELIKNEMDLKIPKRKQFKPNHSHKPHKSRAKPYWTSELQDLWDEVCKQECKWLDNKRGVNSRSLKEEEEFRVARKWFDKLNRQCK